MTYQEKHLILKELRDLYKKGIEEQENFMEMLYNRIHELDKEIKEVEQGIGTRTTPGGNYPEPEILTWFDRLPKLGFFAIGLFVALIIFILIS